MQNISCTSAKIASKLASMHSVCIIFAKEKKTTTTIKKHNIMEKKELKGTKTERNLMEAFAGES